MKTVFTVLLLMLCCTATADVYKWTDKHGVVHYEDQNPAENNQAASVKVEKVELTPIKVLDSGEVKNPGKPNENWWTQWQASAEGLKTDLLQRVQQSRIGEWFGITPVVTNDTVINDKPAQSRSNSVEIYTTSWCPACKKAKRWLSQRGIAYKEYDVEKDPAAALRMNKLGGGGGVPFAVINEKTVLGFDPGDYQAALH